MCVNVSNEYVRVRKCEAEVRHISFMLTKHTGGRCEEEEEEAGEESQKFE
jgi:hypothetical protein